jgi:outer membrane protein assembly factor BamB
VFVTSATEGGASCRILRFNFNDGALVWDREVRKQKTLRKEGQNSYASPTPVTDGERVYAVFADGAIVAVNFAGETVWTNHEVAHFSKHGLGASPILYRNMLIMPFDGSSEKDLEIGWRKPWDGAVILAVDAKTGATKWRAKRGLSRVAHVTPNVAKSGDEELLISGGGDRIQAFHPDDGRLIWTVYSQGEGVVPSIVVGESLVYTASGFEASAIRVVKTGGKGDVTRSMIAWEQTQGVPSLASFVLVGDRLFSITDVGVAHCFDAKTGKILGKSRIGGNFAASPVVAGGKIYFLNRAGECSIVEPTPEFKVTARNALPKGDYQASPAFSNGRIVFRSDDKLYCVGE